MLTNYEYAKLLEPGKILAGKYRVDGTLGKGGMGVVVAATHLALDQRVALKFLLPAALESDEATERFAREARAAVRLRSEHVARVLDVGQLENGSPYMVMELLDGQDLADRMATKEPIAVAQAVDYVLQAGEAVAEAHALGIVHRDLKPRNLFLTQSLHGKPLVKVLDFGISKTLDGGAELSLTRTSAIMGSPNYMSPEQLGRPREVDGRSDVWSLGVILYELLAGQLPFLASTLPELCARVFQDEPDRLDRVRPELPAALADVVQKCLAKKLDERYASVADMARALAPFTAEPAIVDRIERVAATAPLSSVPRVSRASVATLTPVPSPAATSVSWSGEAEAEEPPYHEVDTRLLHEPARRARLFPLVAAVGAVVVAIGAAAVTVSVTRQVTDPTAARATASTGSSTASTAGTAGSASGAGPATGAAAPSDGTSTTATPDGVLAAADAGAAPLLTASNAASPNAPVAATGVSPPPAAAPIHLGRLPRAPASSPRPRMPAAAAAVVSPASAPGDINMADDRR